MKLIVLLLVVSIAVIKASCGELPDGRDLTNGERVQHGTELRGKNGGSKCKSDIVCSLLGGSCVTNSTYCSGREVPSVCSGATCKCCIPVSLDVKVHDLETELQAMVVNLTVSNFNQRTEMDTKMNLLVTNLNTAMNSLVSNLTIANANIFEYMISSNKNLSIANSDLKNELQVIKENVTRQGCPEGLFYFAPSSQCFLMLNDTTRNWYNADTACHAKGLVLAQPYDPVAIRNYTVTKYGDGYYTWIGARGTGSYVKFQRSSRYIGSSNPLWYSRTTSSSYCVNIMTDDYAMKYYGDRVYYSRPCSNNYWALCELVRE